MQHTSFTDNALFTLTELSADKQNRTGVLKMTDMKLQDMKMVDQIAGHENAGHEIARHLGLCT